MRGEPALSENALVVLRNRYLGRDEQGRIKETPAEMFRRVARNLTIIDILYDSEVYDPAGVQEVAPSRERPEPSPPYTAFDLSTLASAYESLRRRGHMRVTFPRLLERLKARRPALERAERKLYDAMAGLDFLFNSPTLMNAGRELQQLSACFVLPVDDSLVSIFDTLKQTALIHQSGGGTGFSFSRLRPKDDLVKSTGGVASGPVSFMGVFDAATNAVKQGGTRRGANMGILRCDHPDILEFINCKTDSQAVTNFNISVAVTDAFMEAVKSGTEYDLINPRTRRAVRSLKARDVFDLIAERAWANGEPGVIFVDRLNQANPTPHVGVIESTNPCGEQPLLPYESCNLGSLNLAHMVSGGKVDYERLGRLVDLAVRYLDNVIDANRYPMNEIELTTKSNRKIGLGVMGWADMIVQLGVPYDSEEAVTLAGEVMAFVNARSKKASAELAAERGAFPNFKGSALDVPGAAPLRNATTTTIAPTGTISIIAGASSGIEPYFSIAFTRKGILGGQELVEISPLFEEVAKRQGFYSEELMAEVARSGSVQDLEAVPAEVKRLFVTALDISPEWHVRMQAAFQKHTDNAVSKTVNLPYEAKPEDIRNIYKMAYDLGCKGVTVYRNGSRAAQVLNVGRAEEPAAAKGASSVTCGAGTAVAGVGPAGSSGAGGPDAGAGGPPAGKSPRPVIDLGPWGRVKPVPRPPALNGVTVGRATPLGNLYLTLNTAGSQPFELFAQIGKAGSDVAAFTEGLARLVSLALRCGVDPREIAAQLSGIGGNRSVGFGPNRVKSVPDAIARFIEDYLSGAIEASPQVPGAGQLVMFDNGAAAREGAPAGDAAEVTGTEGEGVTQAGEGQPPAPDGGGEGRASGDQAATDRTAANRSGGTQPVTKRATGPSYDLCPACGMHSLAYEEGCLKCRSCGYSEC